MITTIAGKALLTISILISACFFRCAEAHAETVLKIGGAGSTLGTIMEVARSFEKLHPEVKVQVLSSLGSTGAVKALRQGAVHIALTARQLSPEERAEGLSEAKYAMTPFVFIVNKNVRVSDLHEKELVEIYAGKTLIWPDGTRIRLVLRPEIDADTLLLKGISRGMDEAVKAALQRKGMLMAMTNQESTDIVAHTPGAFGVATLAQILTETPQVKVLSLNGARPGVDTIANGTYPLAHSLYVVVPKRRFPPAQDFIDFLSSGEGRKILERSGNLPAGR